VPTARDPGHLPETAGLARILEERPGEVTEHSPLQPTLVNATAQVSRYAAASGAVRPAYCSNLAEVVEALIVGVGGVREVGGF
jgi:hypothetical protein